MSSGPVASLISLPGDAMQLCRARQVEVGLFELWTRILVCFWCVLVMKETTEVLVAPSHSRGKGAGPTNQQRCGRRGSCQPQCLRASLGPCPSPPRGKTASGASRSLVNPLGAASCILFDPSSYSRYQWLQRWLGLGGCVRAPAPARPVNMAPRRSGPGTARSRRRLHFTWTRRGPGPPGPGEGGERGFTGTPEHSRVTCPPWRVTSLSRVCFARRREVEAWRRDEVRFAAPGLVRCLHGSGRCQCQSPYRGQEAAVWSVPILPSVVSHCRDHDRGCRS